MTPILWELAIACVALGFFAGLVYGWKRGRKLGWKEGVSECIDYFRSHLPAPAVMTEREIVAELTRALNTPEAIAQQKRMVQTTLDWFSDNQAVERLIEEVDEKEGE